MLRKISFLFIIVTMLFLINTSESSLEKEDDKLNPIQNSENLAVNFIEKKSLVKKIKSKLFSKVNTNLETKTVSKIQLNSEAKTESGTKFEIMEMPHLKKGETKMNLLINIKNNSGCNCGKCKNNKNKKCRKLKECKSCKDCKYKHCKNSDICKSVECNCKKCEDCSKDECKETDLCKSKKCECEKCSDCKKSHCKNKEFCKSQECLCQSCDDCCKKDCIGAPVCNEVECKLKLECHSCKDCDKQFCYQNFPLCQKEKCKFKFCKSCWTSYDDGNKEEKNYCIKNCTKCPKLYEECDHPEMKNCKYCKKGGFFDYCKCYNDNKDHLGKNFKFGMSLPGMENDEDKDEKKNKRPSFQLD